MELNSLLIWMVAASCGLSLLQLLRMRRRSWGRIGLVAGIAGLLGVLTVTVPDRAGYLGGTVWFLLLVLPGLGMTLVDFLIGKRRFALARRLAEWIWWIHPFEGIRSQPKLIHALELMKAGEVAAADELLSELRQSPTALGRTVIVLQTRHLGQWEEFLQWFSTQPQREEWLEDATILDAYLQGLGETNRSEELFAELQRLLVDRQPRIPRVMLEVIRMKAAAFGGDAKLAGQICDSELNVLGPELRAYWQATALMVAGETERAMSEFNRLATSPDATVARAARRRLARPLNYRLAPDEAHPVLDRIAAALHHERRFAILSSRGTARPWGTWGIGAALLAMFLYEVPGGSEDPYNLIEIGALVIPMSLFPGEWWRIVTAAFMHFGPVHLAMNMMGLLIFGARLERAWGMLLMVPCYLITAIGSIGLTAVLSPEATEMTPSILVGASGGVMGIIGALLGHTGVGLLRGKSAAVTRDFNLLFAIVLLQIVFDSQHEYVSSKCHLLGLGLGLICGVIVNLFPAAKRPAS